MLWMQNDKAIKPKKDKYQHYSLLLPHSNFKICFPPFCGSPHWFIIFQFPPPKIFNLYITGLHKLTTNTVSNWCDVSCNSQELKQRSRSKLIFQIPQMKYHKILNSHSILVTTWRTSFLEKLFFPQLLNLELIMGELCST